jgi:hypothetical protein
MKKISRRDFLKVTGLVGAAAALTACGGLYGIFCRRQHGRFHCSTGR